MLEELSNTSKSRAWLWALLLVGVGFFFYATKAILLPFVVGALIAYVLNPFTTRLARGIGRTLGALVSLLLFLAFFILGILGILPFMKAEFLDLSQRLPFYIEKIYTPLRPWLQGVTPLTTPEELEPFAASIQENVSALVTWGLRILAGIFSNTLALANLLSLGIITPLVAFYLLRDWPTILESVDQLLPRKAAPVVRDVLVKINTVLGGYARGQLLVCFILALYYATALKILGLHYALTIGFIAGFFAFIPYFGFLVGVVAALGMALSQFEGWALLGVVGVIFLIGQVVESYILVPKLIGNRVGLHPVWILFALLAGGVLFGFLGLLIALPVAAALGVIVRFGLAAYKNSPYREGEIHREIETHSKADCEDPDHASPSSRGKGSTKQIEETDG